MENGQMQPVQPIQSATPVAVQGMGVPVSPQMQAMPGSKIDRADLLKTIALIVVSLIAVTFIGLFVWKQVEYMGARDDVDGQIAIAVAEAKDEQAVKMEAEFLDREKYPFKTFLGPADYGQLSFEYPKTWSVYVAADASRGGDFEAYFNPIQVDAVSNTTINALRVLILNRSFDDVTAEYQRIMERDNSGLTIQSITVNGAAANRYIGKIPNTELNGMIVIFKIRDKTAVLRTDSVLFEDDFNKVVDSVKFNA